MQISQPCPHPSVCCFNTSGFDLPITLAYTLMPSSKSHFLLKDSIEGKEILDHIRETTPLINLHNDAPSGGEHIEELLSP
jgi:hypothetical protein